MDELQHLIESNKKHEDRITQLRNELKLIPKEKRKSDNRLKEIILHKNEISKNNKIIKNIEKIINNDNISNRINQFGESKDDTNLQNEVDSLIENQKKQELEEQKRKDLEELNTLEKLDSKGLIDTKNSSLFTPETDNEFDKMLEERKREKTESKLMMSQDEDLNKKQLLAEKQKELEKIYENKQKDEQLRNSERAQKKRDKKFERQVKEYELTKKRKMNQNNKTKKNKQKEIQMVTKNGPPEDISTADYETIMNKPILQTNLQPILQTNLQTNLQTDINTDKNGFRETLKPLSTQNTKQTTINSNVICPSIFKSGKNVTKKYYFPSEFPNLTKLKSIGSMKGGTKTKKRKNRFY